MQTQALYAARTALVDSPFYHLVVRLQGIASKAFDYDGRKWLKPTHPSIISLPTAALAEACR
jgi:hypothetical protein